MFNNNNNNNNNPIDDWQHPAGIVGTWNLELDVVYNISLYSNYGSPRNIYYVNH